MSIVFFPKRHPGERQPGAFVVHLPGLAYESTPTVLLGVDAATQVAVLAEVDRLNGAIGEADKCTHRISELLAPWRAEGV